MTGTFDVGFEEYIIFHRGIARVYIDENRDLHVVYQDGTDENMGNPYGNYVNEAVSAAGTATEAKTQIEGMLEDIGSIQDDIDADMIDAEQLRTDINNARADMENMQADVTAKRNEISGKLNNIAGLEEDEDHNGFHIHYADDEGNPNIIGAEEGITAIVSSMINRVAGVTYESDEPDAPKAISFVAIPDAAKSVESMINNALRGTDGIEYSAVNGFYVDFTKEAISDEFIDGLFFEEEGEQ